MQERIRTIITQDAEIDDQNSLRHFLLCANQVELQGIVQTASVFHWIGVPGKETPPSTGELFGLDPAARFDRPWRWPGTEWMQREIDDYAAVYPHLCCHAEGYPSPDELRALVRVGNIGYAGEMDAPSEGSELIRGRILDEDPRPLYIQVWGGTNTIARALLDIQREFENTPDWPALHAKIENKVILTACGEQDDTYRGYIAEQWPGMQFVKCLQMFSYAYPWRAMPRGESFDSLTSDFMRREVLSHRSPLIDGYATWMDGKLYEGEGPDGQFGQDAIQDCWFGSKHGLPRYERYDFLSEGDSPTFFCLMDWGFRTTENFAWGGISGRYVKSESERNSKGQPLNYWDVTNEAYTAPDGSVSEVESMWRYTADIQRDFAARAAWCCTDDYAAAEHAPVLRVEGGTNRTVRPGEHVRLSAAAFVPECLGAEKGAPAAVTWRVYPEASGYAGAVELSAEGGAAELTVPQDLLPGQSLHLIARAQAPGHLGLCRYAQVILTAGTET